MKKLKGTAFVLSALIALLVCAGCSDGKGMQNVQKYYGTSEVVMIPDRSGVFIARKDDGSIWYAYSSGVGERSINHVQLMRPMICTH